MAGQTSGGTGIVGVVVGALLVILVAVAVLQVTGMLNFGDGKKIDINVQPPTPKTQ